MPIRKIATGTGLSGLKLDSDLKSDFQREFELSLLKSKRVFEKFLVVNFYAKRLTMTRIMAR